jgi:protoporphyrinogen oxidase
MDSGNDLSTETLIVGGGVAGLSAACAIKDKDFILCELSDTLGGSSSATEYNGNKFSQGAHYDLSYPLGYGEEVIGLLEDLDIVSYQDWSKSWSFKDRQHIIFHKSKNRCYDHGQFRHDVLTESASKNEFLNLMQPYLGKMHLPTRLIEDNLRHLDQVTFKNYLESNMVVPVDLMDQLDYHMKDDYGAGSEVVSALAGIHYFMCRPYYEQVVELFSPPEGNYYFIDKMAEQLPKEQLKTQSLVSNIKSRGKGYEVEIIDVEKRQVYKVRCNKLIYAGQKHALKHIYPEVFSRFESNQYSPWMVVNVFCKDNLPMPAFWQNEMLSEDTSFMGFVDSATQQRSDKSNRVLTGYYCLPQNSRKDLLNVTANKSLIVSQTIEKMSAFFKQDVYSLVSEVHIKVMGHAMPIPVPGYLFGKDPTYSNKDNLAFAGVDMGRLPLMYEAMDSGLLASKQLGLS